MFSEKKKSPADHHSPTHCFPKIQSECCDETEKGNSDTNKFQNPYDSEAKNIFSQESQPWLKEKSDQNANEQEKLIENAFKDGFEKGLEQGIHQEKKRIDSLVNAFKQAITDLETYRSNLILKSETFIIKLAFAIARKILSKELTIDRKSVHLVVRKALEKVVNPKSLVIRVCPDDLETMNEYKNDLDVIYEKTEVVKIESDTNITVGGCIVNTDFGDIDARIETQLEEIEQAVLNHKRSNR